MTCSGVWGRVARSRVALALPILLALAGPARAGDGASARDRDALRQQILLDEQAAIRAKLEAARARARRADEQSSEPERMAAYAEIERYQVDLSALAVELATLTGARDRAPRTARPATNGPWWDVYAGSSATGSTDSQVAPGASAGAEVTPTPVPLAWPGIGRAPASPRD